MRGNLLLVTLVTISGLCSASSSGEFHASADPEKLQNALYQIESGHLSDPDNARAPQVKSAVTKFCRVSGRQRMRACSLSHEACFKILGLSLSSIR